MKQELLKDKTGILRFTPYINNRAAVASSATVVLKRPDGSTLQASASASVDSTTGEITYSLSSSLTDTLGENYIAEWTYVVSGNSYYYTLLYDVVLHKISLTVVDDDLIAEQADLLDKSESYNGIVDSSSNTTLVDDELKSYADDYWNNGRAEVVNTSTGAKQTRIISDFAASSGTVTISVPWSTNPDTTYGYVLRRGFSTKIEKAFSEIMDGIRAKGFRPALILESTDLHTPVVKKALAMICKDLMKEDGDRWHTLYKIYSEEFIQAMNNVVLQYDRDEGGNIAGTGEQDTDMGSLRMRR